MEKAYWIRRKRAAMASARAAETAEARLGYYELAGRFSIKAAHCPPFLLVGNRPAAEAKRAILHLPGFADVRPGSSFSAAPPRDPDADDSATPSERR